MFFFRKIVIKVKGEKSTIPQVLFILTTSLISGMKTRIAMLDFDRNW